MRSLRLLALFFAIVLPAAGQGFTIQQYLSIRSATAPSFSPDGKRIAYLTNVTGTQQIWLIDAAGGTPKQLTNFYDNVGFVRWLGDGGILFGKAKGGDENTQFFVIKPDGTEQRQLTNDPTVRHNFGATTGDGKLIAYSSNKRDRNYFDVYLMDLATGKGDLVYQQNGSNGVVAINDNGTKIVVSRGGEELSLDNDLYLVDTKTKQATHLTPHTGASEFENAAFVADGLVFTHNDGREFFSLAQMRQKNAAGDDWSAANREVRVLDDTNWDVEDIEMPEYAGVMAYAINREGFNEIRLRKVETGGKPLITTVASKVEKVPLPEQGVVGVMRFSKDQSKLAFSFSSSTRNTDIWVYDLQSKKLDQLTNSDRANIPRESFVAPELIKFKSFDGREISAWYYRPKGSDVIKASVTERTDSTRVTMERAPRAPVIVSVHGGPEGQERPGFSGLYQYYLSRGYAILAPNVRGSTGYGKTYTHLDDVRNREDSVKDLDAAAEWLKRNGSDPRKIAIMGGSYGGYMTLAAITLFPDRWAAAVDTVGIANWESFLKNTSGYRRRQREVEYGRLDRDLDFLRSISPLAKVDRIKAPLFVIQGKNDPRVPYTEAEQIVKAVKDKGGVVQYKLYDDEGHGISKLKNRLELYPLVADFLDKYLK